MANKSIKPYKSIKPSKLQKLTKDNAIRLLEQVKQNIPFMTGKESHLWVAVSGGLDSISLFQALFTLFSLGEIPQFRSLGILHVNHRLRGKESDADELFVQKLAQRFGVEFFCRKMEWGKQEKKNQESARAKREEVYAEALAKYPNAWIALAHHLDDQAETIFLRLLRGTGIQGLRGMQLQSGRKIRPFLTISRSQIHSIAIAWKLSWREDSSNKKTKYERNWLRLKIFPELEKRRPGFSKRLVVLAQECESILSETPSLSVTCARFPRGRIFQQGEIQKLTDRELINLFQLERKHLPIVREAITKSSGKWHLPGTVLWISCGLVLQVKNLDNWRESILEISSEKRKWKNLLGIWSWNKPMETKIFLRFDAEKKNGKIKKEFIDRKIPAFFRESYPLVSIQDQIQIVGAKKKWWQPALIKIQNYEIEFSPNPELLKVYSNTKPLL